jgi:hypothetical protein
MTADEKRISGVTDTTELATIRDAVVSLVAAEHQRVRDKVDSDTLRAQVRTEEDRWKTDTGGRLDRMQAATAHIAGDLQRLHTEVSLLPTALDAKLTAVALATKVEQTAAQIEVERQLAALQLATAPLVQRGADGVVVRKFISAGTRMALSVIACILLIGLSIAMFANRMDLVGDAAGVLAAIAAVVAIAYGNRQPKRG